MELGEGVYLYEKRDGITHYLGPTKRGNCLHCGRPIVKVGEKEEERVFTDYLQHSDGRTEAVQSRKMVTIEKWVHVDTGEYLCDDTKKTGAYPKKLQVEEEK